MKAKVNIRDYLAEQCGGDISMDVHTSVDVEIADLLNRNGIDEEHEFDIDIHEVLAQERKIAHVWGIDDVQEVRPDLDDDQAWQVLRDIEKRLDSQYGICWDTIEIVADELYGPKPERRWHGRIDVTITDTDGYGQEEALTHFRDMAGLLAKDMPDVKAEVLEGSIYSADAGETPKA